jgi:4-oxalocrotonate tautomerase family enzyme
MPILQIHLPKSLENKIDKKQIASALSSSLTETIKSKIEDTKIYFHFIEENNIFLANTCLAESIEKAFTVLQVFILEGRNIEQKRNLVKSFTEHLEKLLNLNGKEIKIIISDMKSSDYAINGCLIQDK